MQFLFLVTVIAGPFLEVIRSEETTGPVTSLALSAVNKFISYGLIGKDLVHLYSKVDCRTSRQFLHSIRVFNFPSVGLTCSQKNNSPVLRG
jgi:hypothetical protein